MSKKRTKKVGLIGKYGTRYGVSLRKIAHRYELTKSQKYLCPYCCKKSVKRKAVGIWKCRRCLKVMTGGAWNFRT